MNPLIITGIAIVLICGGTGAAMCIAGGKLKSETEQRYEDKEQIRSLAEARARKEARVAARDARRLAKKAKRQA